jgi:hypothetical protein
MVDGGSQTVCLAPLAERHSRPPVPSLPEAGAWIATDDGTRSKPPAPVPE